MKYLKVAGTMNTGEEVTMILHVEDVASLKKQITIIKDWMAAINHQGTMVDIASIVSACDISVVLRTDYSVPIEGITEVPSSINVPSIIRDIKLSTHQDKLNIGLRSMTISTTQYEPSEKTITSVPFPIESLVNFLHEETYIVQLTKDQLNNAIDYISISDNESASELVSILRKADYCHEK